MPLALPQCERDHIVGVWPNHPSRCATITNMSKRVGVEPYIGRRFGKLIVLGAHPGDRRSRWRCRCDCGTETVVDAWYVRNGHTTSCGCFGRTHRTIDRGPRPLCACGCGTPVAWNKKIHGWRTYRPGHCYGFRRVSSGPNNPNWNGGHTIKTSGRVAVLRPEHPRADSKGYVLRYVVVAEEKYGRPIASTEAIHHVNGDPSDDRPENLIVLSMSEHNRLHALLRSAP